MRRFRRTASRLAVAVPVLLCAAAVTLWERSYRIADHIEWERVDVAAGRPAGVAERHRWFEIGSVAGGVSVDRGDSTYFPFRLLGAPPPAPPDSGWHVRHTRIERGGGSWSWLPRREMSPRSGSARWRWLGFALYRSDQSRAAGRWPSTHYSVEVVFPYWLLVALTAYLPGRAVAKSVRRRRRRAAGRCLVCGYDLRGSPAAACPECGTTPPRVCGKMTWP